MNKHNFGMEPMKLDTTAYGASEKPFAVDIDTAEEASDFADNTDLNDNEIEVPIVYVDTEQVEIPEIHDVYGRLSDAIESLEDELGISVVPFSMACIAPEVMDLQRHEIFEFGGEKYAFSHRLRQSLVDRYVEIITQYIATGLPYPLELVTSVQYNNQVYRTFELSRDEWELIISKFRSYRHSLKTDNATSMTLSISAEKLR